MTPENVVVPIRNRSGEVVGELLEPAVLVARKLIDDVALAPLPDTLESLAVLLADVMEMKSMIGDLERRIEDATVKAMPEKTARVAGVGTLEKKGSGKNTYWDNQGLFEQLVARAKDPRNRMDPMTGELVMTELELFAKDVRDACAVGYWRVTELGGLHIDADAYREVKPGRVSIRIDRRGA